MKRVAIDPGHGGSDVGAVSPSNLHEADMTLDVCKRIQSLLESQVDVVMTRSDDSYVSLGERADICNTAKCDVFVSYHFNAATTMLANGWEIFTTKKDNNSDKLATCIGNFHAALFPNQHARQDWSDGDLDKEANFSVIRRANCPAVLMEGEFIHNALGESLIRNPANREKMAIAVANGVLKYLGLKLLDDSVDFNLSVTQRLDRIENHLDLPT